MPEPINSYFAALGGMPSPDRSYGLGFAIVGTRFEIPQGQAVNYTDFKSSPACLEALLDTSFELDMIFGLHPAGKPNSSDDDPAEYREFEEIADRAGHAILPIPERSIRRLPGLISFTDAAALIGRTPDALRKQQKDGKLSTIRNKKNKLMLSGPEVAELRRRRLERLGAEEEPGTRMIPGLIDVIAKFSDTTILRTRDTRPYASALLMLSSK